MSSRLEDLRGLAQLLDEGKITEREFEVIKTEILEAPPDEWAAPDPLIATPANGETRGHLNGSVPAAGEPGTGESPPGVESPSDPDWLAFVKQIPPIYWAATVAVLFSLVAIFFSGEGQTVAAAPSTPDSSSEVLAEIPVGSLGIRFGDLAEGWNALDEPPYILKGISTTPEAGPLDSFTYRFDGGALLAGAYNPSDEYIYALMGRAGLGHEASSSMYLHLCYLLYPGTQDCFDAYVEESGVFGKSTDELVDMDHRANWMFGGNEWRLEIADDVQTVRVLGPQQTS